MTSQQTEKQQGQHPEATTAPPSSNKDVHEERGKIEGEEEEKEKRKNNKNVSMVSAGQQIPLRSGDLYMCGCYGGKGSQCFPVDPSAVDNAGHCIYPAKLSLPKSAKGTKFCYVAADTTVFAAIDDQKRLWGWGTERSIMQPTLRYLGLDNVVSCDVGTNILVAVTGEGLLFHYDAKSGEMAKMDTSSGQQLSSGNNVVPAAVQVAACDHTIAVLFADGSVQSVGPEMNNGLGADVIKFTPVALPPVRYIALGSRHGAAITVEGSLFVWGDGLSGNLGLGKRVTLAHTPMEVPFFKENNFNVVHVACTRGQAGVKRMGTVKKMNSGQEGPRTHVVTSDGGLWIAGSTHKGMGGDHLWKTMQPDEDHLDFYRVGGKAADYKAQPVPTGAAEDFKEEKLSSIVARRMGMKTLQDFGKDNCTNYLTDVKMIGSQPVHIHSLAWSEDGRCFVWGCGSDGRLGLRGFMRGPGGSKRTMKCYVSTPSAVEAIEDKKVLFATAGRYWSLFIIE